MWHCWGTRSLRAVLRLLLLATAALALCGPSAGLAEAADGVTTIVLAVFGSSSSSTGPTKNDSPLFVPNRHCNGPIWVDYLADALSINYTVVVRNYASGGASACGSASNKTLTAQTNAFLADVAAGVVPQSDANTFVLPMAEIGGNDILAQYNKWSSNGTLPTSDVITELGNRVAECRMTWAKSVANAGFKTVVLPPIQVVSGTLAVTAPYKPSVRQVEEVVDSSVLASAASPSTNGMPPGSRLSMLGNNNTWVYEGLYIQPPMFLYTDVPCKSRTSGCSDPICCNDYLFMNNAHTTTYFHRWYALQGLLPHLQAAGDLPPPRMASSPPPQ